MNAFVSIVKKTINVVDNNKGFTVALIIATALLAFFSSFGTAVAAMICLIGIRFFISLWLKSNDDVPGVFKVICAGACLFLSAPLISIVQSFVAETSMWHVCLGTIARWIGWTGAGLIGLFFVLGFINWVVVPVWMKLVRWSRK